MRLCAPGGAVVVALVLAGCGGGGSSLSARQIASAAQKTSSKGSLETDFTISGSGVASRGSGVFNTGDRGSGQLKMTVQSSNGRFTVDTVSAGNVLYMRSPELEQFGLSREKQWLKLDLAQLARQRGVDLGGLLNANPNPTSALGYLLGSGGDAKKLGRERVRSADTTHYRVTVDLERAASASSGVVQQSLRSALKASGQKTEPFDVWVDDNGLVRKVVYTQGANGTPGPVITMVFHDFGSHVAITPPPSGSVVDLQDIMQGG
jgi:hypothetical protein